MHFSLITIGSVALTALSTFAAPVFARGANDNAAQNLFHNSTAVDLVGGSLQVLAKNFAFDDNDGAFGLACKNDADRLLAQGQSAEIAAAAQAFCLCLNGLDDIGVNSRKSCTRQHDEALVAAASATPLVERGSRNINSLVNLFGNSTAVDVIGTKGDVQVLGKVFP